MPPIDSPTHPPIIAELLRRLPLAPLGPGKPHLEVRDRLELLGSIVVPQEQRERFAACRAGLWLGFDFLDESHCISQDLHTVEGSFWHGILHRREPDASNAAYWFRRVSQHPVFEPLAREARSLGLRLRSERWDPFEFIDLCEQHRDSGSEREQLLCQVQRREWELLFDWCSASPR